MKHLPANLKWSVVKNAMSQIGGRLLITISKLVVAVIIVRNGSAELFGQYALILSLMLVAEWLVDFGMTDIGVRNICRQPHKKLEILKILTYLKIPHFLLSFLLLMGFVMIMGYEPVLVRAALFGGFGLVFYAGATVYRALFRADMLMEKDVGGELVGVLIMVPLTWYASWKGLGVDILIACFVVSRVAYFAMALILGSRYFRLNPMGTDRREAATFYRQILPLGLIGILVAGYESTAPIVLSRFMDMQAVGYYSVAMRFMLPVVIVTQSIAGAFYPVLSSYWNKSSSEFKKTQQNSLEITFLIAGAIFCVINAGAEFFMGLVGPEMVKAAYILRILSWAILVKAVASAMYPLVIVAGGEAKAFWLIVLSAVTNVVVVLWVVPRYGLLGVALAFVSVEFLLSMIPSILVSQHLAKVRMDWLPLLKACLSAVLALVCSTALGQKGTIWGSAVALLIYLVLTVITGALSLNKLRGVLDSIRTRTSATDNS